MEDPRINLLNAIADSVPAHYFRDDGTARHYYAYAWFHRETCIYAGKGADRRYLLFFQSLDYNTAEAHEYIARHADELEPFYVASRLTSTAAFAVEHYLIEHFKRRSDGGVLFNVAAGQLAQPPVSGEVLSYGKAVRAEIPPGIEPLSKQNYIRFVDDHGTPLNALTYWRDFRIALKAGA